MFSGYSMLAKINLAKQQRKPNLPKKGLNRGGQYQRWLIAELKRRSLAQVNSNPMTLASRRKSTESPVFYIMIRADAAQIGVFAEAIRPPKGKSKGGIKPETVRLQGEHYTIRTNLTIASTMLAMVIVMYVLQTSPRYKVQRREPCQQFKISKQIS